MAYKLIGEMVTGSVAANIIPQTDGTGSTLVHIVVSSAQDVIQTDGITGLVVGRIHLRANQSIDLTKKAVDTVDIAADAFVTPIAYHW